MDFTSAEKALRFQTLLRDKLVFKVESTHCPAEPVTITIKKCRPIEERKVGKELSHAWEQVNQHIKAQRLGFYKIQCNSAARAVVLIDNMGLAFTVFNLVGEGTDAKFEPANTLPNATRTQCETMAATATAALRAAAAAASG